MHRLGIREVQYDGYLITYLVGYEAEFNCDLPSLLTERTWADIRDCAREYLYDQGYWTYDAGEEWDDIYDADLWALAPVQPNREELAVLQCDFTQEVLPLISQDDEYAEASMWFEALSAQTPEPPVPEQAHFPFDNQNDQA